MQEREEEQGQAEPVGYDGEFCLFSLSALKGSLWMLLESRLERARMERTCRKVDGMRHRQTVGQEVMMMG